MFGYERGAFTGAMKSKPGKFDMADGGTILLDEIGDMDFRLQAKLLQVLQDQEFERVGGTETIHVNVRVMAATHTDLEKAMKEVTLPRGSVLSLERGQPWSCRRSAKGRKRSFR